MQGVNSMFNISISCHQCLHHCPLLKSQVQSITYEINYEIPPTLCFFLNLSALSGNSNNPVQQGIRIPINPPWKRILHHLNWQAVCLDLNQVFKLWISSFFKQLFKGTLPFFDRLIKISLRFFFYFILLLHITVFLWYVFVIV